MMAMAMEPLRTAPLVTSRLEMSGDSEEEERVMTEPHIVVEWLTFLQLGQYSRGFIENGYDDLETVKKIGPADLDAIGVMSAHHRAFLLDAVRVLKEQGAAWVYLLLGSAGQDSGKGYEMCGDPGDHDRVSASSGIASGSGTSSSQPWLEDQDLSGSSCECSNSNTDNSNSSRKSERRGRRQRQQQQHNNNNNGAVTVKAECHGDLGPGPHLRSSPVSSRESNSASPGLNSAYRAMVSLAGNRTPSIEQSVCLTETTDCPSDISVITSISAAPTGHNVSDSRDRTHVTDTLESRLCHPDLIQVHRRGNVSQDSDLIQRLTSRDTCHKSRDTRGPVTLPPTHLRAMVRDRLRAEGISLSAHPYTQAGDSGSHLASLAATLAEDFSTNFSDVLGQLEDLRLAEWSDHAPPPPSLPSGQNSSSRPMPDVPHTYQNMYSPPPGGTRPGHTVRKSYSDSSEPIYCPGQYAPSSCLSDNDCDDIYDFAGKYRTQIRQHQAKMLMTPQGWIQIAKRIISKSKSRDGDQPGHHVQGRPLPPGGHRQSSCPPNTRSLNPAHSFMPVSVPVSSTMMMFPHGQRSFNGSENDLHLNYNTIGGGGRPQAMYTGGVRYSPDGGPRAVAGDTEAEIQMYKTRVIYHSGGADQDHEASV